MKKLISCIIFLAGFSLFSENRVTIKADRESVTALIELNEGESINLNPETLYLLIESNDFNYQFNGYPDGDIDSEGIIIYRDKLVLNGTIYEIDGIKQEKPSINVIVGFQISDKDGNLQIPVEISEEFILAQERDVSGIIILLSALTIALAILIFIIYKRKRA